MRARTAVLVGRSWLVGGVGVRAARLRGLHHLTAAYLGGFALLQAARAGLRRIVGQRQPFPEEVVDLAISGGVPECHVGDGRGVLARLMIAQQMTDLVNQHGGVLFHGVAVQPLVVAYSRQRESTVMLAIKSVLTGIRLKSPGAK